MQSEPRGFWLQSDEMRAESRSARQVVHASVSDFDICSLGVELHVGAGVFLGQGVAILEQVDTDLLCTLEVEDAVERSRVITYLGGCPVTFRGYAVALNSPTADQHHAAVRWRVRGLEIGDIAGVVTGHVLDRTTTVDLADICLLGWVPAFRLEFILVGVEFDL